MAWKRKTSYTSATNSDTAGSTSEVPTTILDSVGQRKTSLLLRENEGSGPAEFEGSGVSRSPSVGHGRSDLVLNEDIPLLIQTILTTIQIGPFEVLSVHN